MSPRLLALHVLRTLAQAQRAGRRLSFEEVAASLRVRRTDVRASLSRLHREGLVDVPRLRLTLAGFALGRALRDVELPALRVASRAASAA
jgi:Mn-dependent DtxR family transcriptional regulator